MIFQDAALRLNLAKAQHADLLAKVPESEANVNRADASASAVVRVFAQLNGLDGNWAVKPDGTGLVRV
jgi:hypothetical protein